MNYYDEEFKKIRGFLLENPRGLTISEISDKLNINRNSVAKYLDVLTISGQIEQKSIGPAKVFFLSQRVPLSAILNFSSDYIVVLNKDLKIIQINDNFLKLMKQKKENLIGNEDLQKSDFIGREIEDEKECFISKLEYIGKLKKALNGEEIIEVIHFNEHKENLYFIIKFVPTIFEKGEKGITIILEDITKIKRTEQKLQESENRYKRLIEGSPDLIYLFSNKKGGLYYSKQVTKTLGYSREYLLKNSLIWHDSIHPEDINKVDIAIKDALNGEEFDIEYRIKDKKGKWHWFHDRFIGTIEKGKETIIEGIATDITERKKSEEELKIKDMAIEASTNGIGITDLKGKLIYVNGATVKMWGYESKEEIIGKNLLEFWQGDEVFNTMKDLQRKGFTTKEDIGKRKDGSLFKVQVFANIIKDENGNPKYMVGFFVYLKEKDK